MTKVSRTINKTKFQNGDKPTEQDFVDLLDSYVHLDDDKATQAMIDAAFTNPATADNNAFVTPKILAYAIKGGAINPANVPTASVSPASNATGVPISANIFVNFTSPDNSVLKDSGGAALSNTTNWAAIFVLQDVNGITITCTYTYNSGLKQLVVNPIPTSNNGYLGFNLQYNWSLGGVQNASRAMTTMSGNFTTKGQIVSVGTTPTQINAIISNPLRVRLSKNSTFYLVLGWGDSSVKVFSKINNSLITSFGGFISAFDILLDEANNRIFVCGGSGGPNYLKIFTYTFVSGNFVANQVGSDIFLNSLGFSMAFANNKLYVVSGYQNAVIKIIDLANSNSITSIDVNATINTIIRLDYIFFESKNNLIHTGGAILNLTNNQITNENLGITNDTLDIYYDELNQLICYSGNPNTNTLFKSLITRQTLFTRNYTTVNGFTTQYAGTEIDSLNNKIYFIDYWNGKIMIYDCTIS
jgi:hypothetical protein